jgi:hypothetical protein
MNARLFLIALTMLSASTIHGQMRIALNLNVKADTAKMNRYELKKEKEEFQKLVLNMSYGSEKILNPEKIRVLRSANILSVELIYTGYPFDPEIVDELMKRRLLELYFLAPDVFKQSMTKWTFIEQNGCKNTDEARGMFHGFVIRYMKPEPYKTEGVAEVKKRLDKKSEVPGDTTVIAVLKRNPGWKKELIVADFTGSMSPYFEQVFLWFYLKKFSSPVNFVFFNDGDLKPDASKRVGSTGGVYPFTTDNVDTLIQQGLFVMQKGNGGDTPENDVEAISTGLKKFDKVKELILIADNWADMRDYPLIKTIDKPVHVILCGTQFGINTQYLDLAKATGGSIHTMEEDLTNLAKIREGEKIIINKTEFIIRGGKFVMLIKV